MNVFGFRPVEGIHFDFFVQLPQFFVKRCLLFLFGFQHRHQRPKTCAAVCNGFCKVADLHSDKLLLLGHLTPQLVQRVIGPLPATGPCDQLVHDGMMLCDILNLMQQRVMQRVSIDAANGAFRLPLLAAETPIVSDLSAFGRPGRVDTAAVGTMHQPTQEVVIGVLTGRSAGRAACDAVLDTLPGVPLDKRFMAGFVAPVAELLHSQVSLTCQQVSG